MLKKMFLGVAIMAVILVGINVYDAHENEPLTDEAIAYQYMVEEFGEGDYDIEIFEDEDDEFISFRGIGNGVDYGVSLNRTFYTDLYTE